MQSPLVTTAWLADHLNDSDLRVFDTTITLKPNPDGFGYLPENGYSEWQAAHIPGAGFIDVIAELSDPDHPIPFMMPPTETFAAIMAAKGIDDSSTVVLYNSGLPMWSTRVWWMLRSIGFDKVAVLDGGWEKWQRENRPVDNRVPNHPPGQLTASPRPAMWANKETMLAMIESGGPVGINALSPQVYSGEVNTHGRPGHLPGTHNVFYDNLINPETGEFLPPEQLKSLFADSRALDKDQVITYCGGGVSATMVSLALELCGQHQIAVYDGSMSEWVRDETLPLKLGAEP